MENNEITVCLTSCGRFDLLEKTVKSLVQNWGGPKPKALHIFEDKPFQFMQVDNIRPLVEGFCEYHRWYNTDKNGRNMGQIFAIDYLYSLVNTPYIFHCEDDILFHTPGFIQQSLDILEHDQKVVTVWIRDKKDMNRHPITGTTLQTPSGTKYRKLATNYRNMWHGFAFYAGLRRKSDYDLVAPYSQFPGNSLDVEAAIGKEYYKRNFYAVTLIDGYCSHIGASRSLPK